MNNRHPDDALIDNLTDAIYFRWLVNNARIAFSESGEVTLKFTLSSDSFLGLRDAVRQAMKGEKS